VNYISYVNTTNSPTRGYQTKEHSLEASPDNNKLSDWVLERI